MSSYAVVYIVELFREVYAWQRDFSEIRRFLPNIRTHEHPANAIRCCQIQYIFAQRVLTIDKSWVYSYDVKTLHHITI